MINKWDLIKKENNTSKLLEEKINNKIQPLNYVPIIFTSVVKKQRIHKLLNICQEVYENRKQSNYIPSYP